MKRDKNAYADDVRKPVLLLQSEAGVAAANVARAIDIVSCNIFHHEFKESLPSTQTALNICDEGFVLSNMQSAEAILSSTNVISIVIALPEMRRRKWEPRTSFDS